MYELALFAGAGGGILGGKLLGWRTVCAVERDPYARAVLAARQNDGCLDLFPIWDDVRTFTKRNNAVSARQQWATPTVHGNYNRKGSSTKAGDGLATQAGGPLNPRWVEWLMGWPIGWTNCAASATDRFRKWCASHGSVSPQKQPEEPKTDAAKAA